MRQKQRRHFSAALAGILPDVIAKLNREIVSISNMPDAEEKLRQLGTEVIPNNTPENLTQFLHVCADADLIRCVQN